MNKINVKKWHNYRLCDLFKIKPAKGKNSQQLNDGNDVPYIAASKECNGFNRMVAINGFENWVSEGNCIQLIHIGDAAAGYANYIPDKFIAMSGKSSCAYNKNMTKYSGLFIAAIICKTNKNKYSFKDSWTGDKVKNTIITLPYKTNDEPDWAYMESYMKNIIQESEQNIENLRNINNSKKKINLNNWKNFKIGGKNGLFEVTSPYARSAQTYNEGNMPYIASGCFNNGVCGYFEQKNKKDFDKGNCITVSPVDGYAFYQKKDFLGRGGAGSSIIILRRDNLNEYIGKFICTVIRNTCNDWSYSNMGNKDKLKNTIIKLPTTPNGEPDWEYMENYMKNIMQESEWNIQKIQKLDCCK